MQVLYNLSVFFYQLVIQLAALTGNRKAALWINGRKNIFQTVRGALNPGERRIWFHCASLGEFEQGRPLMEQFRVHHPGVKIVLTFFSPSGYEVRKNYSGADYVFYLPMDSASNAKKFISLIRPEKAFFVKYEYWFYYFEELRKNNIPNFLVSAIFRPEQRFFQWYGGFFRRMLKSVSHFFVQDERSAALLNSIGLNNFTVTGDTRFDRVVAVAGHANPIPLIEKFKDGKKIFISGSTWQKDEQIICDAFSEIKTHGLKLIIVPHEISEKKINGLLSMLSGYKTVTFSEAKEETVASAEVLVIDNIGMLSSLYRYGSFAYIGGGFGSGIHNVLEAAVFGMPVFFGPNYRKFKEANELVEQEGAFSIRSSDELLYFFNKLINDQDRCDAAGSLTKDYVYGRRGAAEKILGFFEKT